jgi:hypothetical protein
MKALGKSGRARGGGIIITSEAAAAQLPAGGLWLRGKRCLFHWPKAAAPLFQNEDKEGRIRKELCLWGEKGRGRKD